MDACAFSSFTVVKVVFIVMINYDYKLRFIYAIPVLDFFKSKTLIYLRKSCKVFVCAY